MDENKRNIEAVELDESELAEVSGGLGREHWESMACPGCRQSGALRVTSCTGDSATVQCHACGRAFSLDSAGRTTRHLW